MKMKLYYIRCFYLKIIFGDNCTFCLCSIHQRSKEMHFQLIWSRCLTASCCFHRKWWHPAVRPVLFLEAQIVIWGRSSHENYFRLLLGAETALKLTAMASMTKWCTSEKGVGTTFWNFSLIICQNHKIEWKFLAIQKRWRSCPLDVLQQGTKSSCWNIHFWVRRNRAAGAAHEA